MANDLKAYNHLNNNNESSQDEDGFVEFLLQHSELMIPEIDESRAWEDLNKKIKNPNKGFAWIKIAASVAIISILSVIAFLYQSPVTQLQVASADEKISVTFPDGSIGILNANSTFSYPEKFTNERNVTFTGEAYFDIKKDDKPFVISVEGINVRVLGTAFNLVSTENSVELFVDRGLVAFEKDGEQTQVPAGKEAHFMKEDGNVILKEIVSKNIMSWRNGVFNFDNTPLNEALNELSEYYNVDFEYDNDKLKTCKISVTFKDQSLKEVLTTLSSILDVKTSTSKNVVKISGQGC